MPTQTLFSGFHRREQIFLPMFGNSFSQCWSPSIICRHNAQCRRAEGAGSSQASCHQGSLWGCVWSEWLLHHREEGAVSRSYGNWAANDDNFGYRVCCFIKSVWFIAKVLVWPVLGKRKSKHQESPLHKQKCRIISWVLQVQSPAPAHPKSRRAEHCAVPGLPSAPSPAAQAVPQELWGSPQTKLVRQGSSPRLAVLAIRPTSDTAVPPHPHKSQAVPV